ncbi:MAG: succinyldiaminopimelate transaminase [Gammaproteobacteria bacterium]|nr:MAG: succinyldiaminopimelate transaminase [Pseudomonadota bacterium]PIE39011.1 MAG: succinyldiaminopimelate transaminase [Gammaproteobacteria bacterium]
MNPDLKRLQPYPFEKLNQLKSEVTPTGEAPHIALSIGEPKHPAPPFALQAIRDNLDKASNYAATHGLPELRETIRGWLARRFQIPECHLDPARHIIPVAGTREALFSFTQAVINRDTSPVVISPNPFYQIYEGAAFLAGAEVVFLPCRETGNFIPDYDRVPESTWERCQLLFICSPGNPTGAVTNKETLAKLIALSDKYDFVIASDECYSEIYCDEAKPPTGLLEVCAQTGRSDFRNCLVFHSLSKRSNLPGIRSGFVAGDARLLAQYLTYRTYHGCALPLYHQIASVACWKDEEHVRENRNLYRQKFQQVLAILQPVMDVQQSEASFYLWAATPISDEMFAQQLYARENVTVLPGSYLSREVDGENPGRNRIRMALVAPVNECVEAARRIRRFVESLVAN